MPILGVQRRDHAEPADELEQAPRVEGRGDATIDERPRVAGGELHDVGPERRDPRAALAIQGGDFVGDLVVIGVQPGMEENRRDSPPEEHGLVAAVIAAELRLDRHAGALRQVADRPGQVGGGLRVGG